MAEELSLQQIENEEGDDDVVIVGETEVPNRELAISIRTHKWWKQIFDKATEEFFQNRERDLDNTDLKMLGETFASYASGYFLEPDPSVQKLIHSSAPSNETDEIIVQPDEQRVRGFARLWTMQPGSKNGDFLTSEESLLPPRPVTPIFDFFLKSSKSSKSSSVATPSNSADIATVVAARAVCCIDSMHSLEQKNAKGAPQVLSCGHVVCAKCYEEAVAADKRTLACNQCNQKRKALDTARPLYF